MRSASFSRSGRTPGKPRIVLVVHEAAHKELWRVGLPPPFCSHRILVVPPTENALVGTGERRRGLHALVRRNSIKGVLVAAAAAPEHALRPPANGAQCKNENKRVLATSGAKGDLTDKA